MLNPGRGRYRFRDRAFRFRDRAFDGGTWWRRSAGSGFWQPTIASQLEKQTFSFCHALPRRDPVDDFW